MKTLSIQLSDEEYSKLGIQKDMLSLDEIIDIVKKKVNQETLQKSLDLAEKHSLSNMTQDEILAEVKGYRDAQTHP
ncbi:MAG: hypothetical protein RIF33_01090 [Cyclobacteriaceae bacterium]